MLWGRAIIECVVFDEYITFCDKAIISFDKISSRMLKYYWNRLFFFNLKQSPYKDKCPVICKDTEKLIEKYKLTNETTIPIWFDEAEKYFKINNNKDFDNTINHISKTLHENVSWRFKNVTNGTLEIYEYDKNKSTIIINNEDIYILKEYATLKELKMKRSGLLIWKNL